MERNGSYNTGVFPATRHMHAQSASEKTSGLAGSSGIAAIPATALDLPLVQRLPQSRRLYRIPVSVPGVGHAMPMT